MSVSDMDYFDRGFEDVSTWEGSSWREDEDKECKYCGEPIKKSSKVRFRSGCSPYDRGLRHSRCARQEIQDEKDSEED